VYSKELCKSAINPIINPNPVYSHSHTRDNIINFTTQPGPLLERHLGTLSYFVSAVLATGDISRPLPCNGSTRYSMLLELMERIACRKLAYISDTPIHDLTDQRNVWFSSQFYGLLPRVFHPVNRQFLSHLFELHAQPPGSSY
jgi:hypothetical protein